MLAALLAAGCGVAPPESVGEVNEALFANDKAAYDYFVGKGLTSFQAAGIVGNLDQESGMDPNAVQFGGGPGRGIAQWSVGGRWDTSRNDNVATFAAQHGQSPQSLGLQLDFIWYELTTFGYGFAALKATGNVTDATVVFQDQYEICGACAQAQRITYAKAVLNAYGATPAYGAKYVSQSWPLAATALTIQCGEDVAANIVLRNVGAKAWDANTKLGTTQPRDRASRFVAPDWASPNRAAHVVGSVAPNATFQFNFVFRGPSGNGCVPGDYHEFFDLLEEGVAWFGDPGEGGPPDNQLEAWIKLVPAPVVPDMANPAPREMDMAMAEPSDMARSTATTDLGHEGDLGGDPMPRPGDGDAGVSLGADSGAPHGGSVGLQSGCSVGSSHRPQQRGIAWGFVMCGVGLALARRRGRARIVG